MVSYKNPGIWPLARKLTIGIHNMTLQKRPEFEMFEEAPEIRRSIKSAKKDSAEHEVSP